jgi:acyl-CoA synthetase (AMP-forming)/AMP-acid ligase II
VAVNYRLKTEDIAYILDHAGAEAVIVDAEFRHLLGDYVRTHPDVRIIIDDDTDATEGELSGPFDAAVLEGLQYDEQLGGRGWSQLEAQARSTRWPTRRAPRPSPRASSTRTAGATSRRSAT